MTHSNSHRTPIIGCPIQGIFSHHACRSNSQKARRFWRAFAARDTARQLWRV